MMKLETARSAAFYKKFSNLAEKHGLEFGYDESRKSGSTYFDWGTPDWEEAEKIRISDHYSGTGNMGGINHNFYNEDFKNSAEFLKKIEELMIDFKERNAEHWK